jgi:hypothetical protein
LPFGLATAGGIQGTVEDAIADILEAHGVHHVIKWVDDYDFFQEPSSQWPGEKNVTVYIYSFDLDTILAITVPLGVPWHDIIKGGIFSFLADYVGFLWDLLGQSVAVLQRKHEKYLECIELFLASPKSTLEASTKLLGTLQHTTFVHTWQIFPTGAHTLHHYFQ